MIKNCDTATTYTNFLQSKALTAPVVGFPVNESDMPDYLFGFQKRVVAWSLRRGRAAVFTDTGTGKSRMEIAWADYVSSQTSLPVIIFCPLAVAAQTVKEGAKVGVTVTLCRSQEDVKPGVNIANYDRLHLFTPSAFGGIVLDECFAPDTKIDVLSPDGVVTWKYIKDIHKGDRIVNASGVDVVADVHRREVPYAVRVTIGQRRILCSPNHPFFTRRGWVGAQDLIPSDEVMATPSAMRLVREGFSNPVCPSGEDPFLRQVLLSEMANEPTGIPGECSQSRSRGEAREEAKRVSEVGHTGGVGSNRAGAGVESDVRPCGTRESLPPIERDEPRTFRAWGKWEGDNGTATDFEGCAWRGMDDGVCLVTGAANSGLSNALQNRLSQQRKENRYRSGWSKSPFPQGAGREEGREADFYGVDSIEILEPGHSELEPIRGADGKLYFYDIGATRHPSFSVEGVLVHNSSILKSYNGATKQALLDFSSVITHRLAATATPSPNDHTELGNHAEFLSILSRVEMLATFFTHDGGDTSVWRLRGWAKDAFWRWVASWAIACRKPGDIGFPEENARYTLPELRIVHHPLAIADDLATLTLFTPEAVSLSEQRSVKKQTLQERCQRAADLVAAEPDESWLIWCELNNEAELLCKLIPGSVQVQGSDSPEVKERRLMDFAEGRQRVLITKSSIAGFGLNWQHCARTIFVSVSHSYESFYQSVRRFWRFGQKREVIAHLIYSEQEAPIVRNITRKQEDAETMQTEMIAAMATIERGDVTGAERETNEYKRDVRVGAGYTAYLGDCVEVLRELAPESIGYSIFSPPFSSLYTYSNSDRDMGNAHDDAQFMAHFGYAVTELFRVLKTGRLVSFHCMNLPLSKERDGVIGIKDFRGELIRLFQKAGFVFHSEVVIWKDPVTAMQRTKAIGLLHKQLVKDRALSRQGIPDYLVTMRKPGTNDSPVHGLIDDYYGEDGEIDGKLSKGIDPTRYSIDVWQRYASPVWMDINPSDTLQFRSVREENDERHICPLALQVIKRGIRLWSNPDDVVLDPFGGIGSTGVVALGMGRRCVTIELKESYYKQLSANLKVAEMEASSPTLFDDLPQD